MEHKSLIIAQDQILIDKLVSVFGNRECDIQQAHEFLAGLELAVNVKYDFIVMELYPPWKKALQPLLVMRRCNSAILIVLMPESDESDRMRCLNHADGFAWLPTKPAKLKKVLSEAVMHRKRHHETVTSPFLYCRGLILFMSHQRVFHGFHEISFTPTEYALLHHLMFNRDIVQSRETLLQEVWGYDFAGGTNTVNTHVQKIRAKLAEKTDEIYIETISKTGYQFMSENPSLYFNYHYP